jgi:GT2 family glycosyltransferase
VQPGWIEPIIKLMEYDVTIAACQPKILSYHNKNKFEYAGASGGWLDSFGYPFNRGRIFDVCEFDKGQYNNAEEIFWASGAALFIRAGIYKLMNGFDEFFFAHQEEIDLCWRIQLAGYKIFIQPASVVYHLGGGTLPMGNKKKVFLNFRNNLVMLTKNLPALQAFWKIPFRIGLDTIAAWKGLLTGSGVTFTAIANAHYHYWKWLFLSKRTNNGKKRKTRQLQGLYRGLIIWDYFVRGRETFSEIVSNKNNI